MMMYCTIVGAQVRLLPAHLFCSSHGAQMVIGCAKVSRDDLAIYPSLVVYRTKSLLVLLSIGP